MKYVLWLLKAAIFFTLFAFALNNQHDATVYFFFGTYWRAPLVLVVLAAFAGGMIVGALGMLPGWWKHRTAAATQRPTDEDAAPVASAPATSNDRKLACHRRSIEPRVGSGLYGPYRSGQIVRTANQNSLAGPALGFCRIWPYSPAASALDSGYRSPPGQRTGCP